MSMCVGFEGVREFGVKIINRGLTCGCADMWMCGYVEGRRRDERVEARGVE